jgi:hypothetical protein
MTIIFGGKKMKRLLLAVLAVLMSLTLLAGCAASRSYDNASPNYYGEGSAAEAPAEAPQPSAESAPAEDAGAGSGFNFDNSIMQPGVNRKIIYEGNIEARTKNFEEDLDTILTKLKEYGGYQQNASVSGTKPAEWQDRGRSARLELRVPSEHFDDFMNVLKGLGETVSTSVNGRDVSEEYFDTQSRLKTLRTQLARLEALLEKASTLEDIIEIENAIENTTSRIEDLEIQLRNYDSLIDYSIVIVYLTEVNAMQAVKPTDEPLGERITNAFYDVLNVLAKFGEGLLIFLIGGSPILVPLAIVGIVLIIVFRVRRKKKAAAQNDQPPTI